VLLTGLSAHDGDHFALAAQWPRSHSFYGPSDGRHDPMLMAETIRQTGLFIGHLGYQVPLGHAFLMKTMHYQVDAAGLSLGDTPSDLLVHVICQGARKLGTSLVGLGFEARVERDGVTIGSGGGTYSCVSPSAYAKLRAGRLPVAPTARAGGPGDSGGPRTTSDPVPPAMVGRSSPDDVVISPAGPDNLWTLRIDHRHPVLFDHPLDHVPGMVVLEAARQALLQITGPGKAVPVAMTIRFLHYVELDEPAFVRAEPGPRDFAGSQPVRFLIEQRDKVRAEIEMLAEPADR
jgi:hypothetical protein